MSAPNNGDTSSGSLWPTASFGGSTGGSTGGTGGADRHSASNKGMPALATASDGALATSTALAGTPSEDGFVEVSVNGVQVEVGDGAKTKSCYFSSDLGTTAKAMAGVSAGDKLYWNGSIAAYQLAVTDRLDFDYAVAAA